MSLFLILELLFLTSLVPPVEFRFQLLVRGLAIAPLSFACIAIRIDLTLYWGFLLLRTLFLVLECALGGVLAFEGLVGGLGG